MVNLIFGRSGSGKSTLLLDEMKRMAADGEREIVLIVPEQQTVVWETRIARELPETTFLRLEVTNFTRLANSVFRMYGGLAEQVVDDGSRALIVWRAMCAVWNQVTTLGNNAGLNGAGGREDRYIPQLIDAIDELKGSGIAPSEAEKALTMLETNGDDTLAARLRDAVYVYAAYNEMLHENYIDRGDLLEILLKTIKKHPYFHGKAVFIDSFFSLTAMEEGILAEIIKQADEVTLTFSCPPELSDDSEFQFDEVRLYAKNVLRIAAKCGAEVRKIALTEDLRHKKGSLLSYIEKYLYDYKNTADVMAISDRDSVKILRCTDRFDEAEACASIVGSLIRQGYRYRDIAIVARDMKKLAGITDAALVAHGIPCFVAESGRVSTSPAVRFIMAALAVEASGWMRRDIIRLIKTGLSPLDEYESDIFELYTETWKIRGRKMYTDPEGWSMNPDGYKTELTERGRLMLEYANRARVKLITPLEGFLSVFNRNSEKTAEVREICERIVYFAEETGLEESLSRIAGEYRSSGMTGEAAIVESGWRAVCEILDRIVDMLGGDGDSVKLDAGRFSGLFMKVAASMDIGSIPTAIDEVILGSASGIRFDEVRCIVMLGCTDGEFPGAANEKTGFFTDTDRIKLENIGLRLSSPDARVMAARENFMFYRTAAAAVDRLYMIVPGSDGELSETVQKTRNIVNNTTGTDPVAVYDELPLCEIMFDKLTAEYLISKRASFRENERRELLMLISESAAKLYDVPIRADNDTAELHVPDISPEGTDNGKKLKKYTGKRINLTESRIEKFLDCPFMYWCKYHMKLEANAEAEISIPEVGTFVHEILEKFFRILPERDYSKVTAQDIEKYTDICIAEHLERLTLFSGVKVSPGMSGADTDAAPDISNELKRILPKNYQLNIEPRLEYLYIRLRRSVLVFIEAIIRELKQSKFKPTAFELPIGVLPRDSATVDGSERAEDTESTDNSVVEPIVYKTDDGSEVVLRGIADRVDIYTDEAGRKYVRVIDYKTGEKTFSLDDVRRGYGIQLLVYLFSIWKSGIPGIAESGELMPGGGSYFVVRPGNGVSDTLLSFDEAKEEVIGNIGKSGIYLADEDVLRAMDERLEGEFIPIRLGKNGLKATSAALATYEEFGELYNELSETIESIAEQLMSGCANAKPNQRGGRLPCEYCSNRIICRI